MNEEACCMKTAEADDPVVVLHTNRYEQGTYAPFDDVVALEEPVVLHWKKQSQVHLWASPRKLDELALGHAALELCTPGHQPVLSSNHKENGAHLFYLDENSSETVIPMETGIHLTPDVVLAVMDSCVSGEGLWGKTGAYHRACAYDPKERRIACHAEDIGRHNCVDRLAGQALKQGIGYSDHVLFISARATASLVRKADLCGFRIMISKSAVTTAGLAAAKEHNMTLAGFTRGNRYTVYHDPHTVFKAEAE
jgi:FdhD protein